MDQRLRAVDLLHICKKSKKSEIVKDIREETWVQIEGSVRENTVLQKQNFKNNSNFYYGCNFQYYFFKKNKFL